MTKAKRAADSRASASIAELSDTLAKNVVRQEVELSKEDMMVERMLGAKTEKARENGKGKGNGKKGGKSMYWFENYGYGDYNGYKGNNHIWNHGKGYGGSANNLQAPQ